jgi:flagellar FliJ protein
MARFKFRLATLLKLREAARDERRTELAQAYRADDVLRGYIEGVVSELNSLKDQCRKAAKPGMVNIDRLIEAQRYEIVLKQQQRHLHDQRQRLGAEIERRRVALLAANREVRILEKLREQQAQRHRQEENRLEIKHLDEVARLRSLAVEDVG